MITRYIGQLSQNSTDVLIFIENLVLALKQCGFTEVTPIGAGNRKAVQFNSLIIEMTPYNNAIYFYYYIKYDSETKTERGMNSVTVCQRPDKFNISPLSCSLYVFYSDDGNFFALNIAGYNTQIGKGTWVLFDIKTDSNEICYVGASTNPGYYSVQQYRGEVSLKRDYAKEENVFFKEDGVPLVNSNDNSYIMDLPYLTTLGGAEKSHTYTMTNGDNYYCLTDNIAVKFDTTAFSQTAGG